jgi:menaquinol-cytochrome c reductase iron-sulfur subunit
MVFVRGITLPRRRTSLWRLSVDRRSALGWFVKGVGLTVGGIVAVPAVLSMLSPVLQHRREERWVPVGPLDSFELGQVRRANVPIPTPDWNKSPAAKSVYILRRSEEETVVYSRNCTDLSCPLTWDAGSNWFYCPCHGGIFCIDGEPQAGPPSRPMYRYSTRIRDGVLEIDLNSLPPMT